MISATKGWLVRGEPTARLSKQERRKHFLPGNWVPDFLIRKTFFMPSHPITTLLIY
jgi:hypothetical protein